METDNVSCTFNITPRHLHDWVTLTKGIPAQDSLNLTEAADMVLVAVFAYVPFVDVQEVGTRQAVQVNDPSLISGRRSVEIERTYPLSASGLSTLVYRITIVDTVGDINDVVLALRHKGLVDDDRRLKVLLGDTVHYEPAVPTFDTIGLHIACLIAFVVLVVSFLTP